jgi:hypothetical protein
VLIRDADPDSAVDLLVVRHGQPQTISAKLVEKRLPPLVSEQEALSKMQNWTMTGSAPGKIAPGGPFPSAVDFGTKGPIGIITAVGPTSVVLNRDNGTFHLTVTEPGGNSVFDGDLHSLRELRSLGPQVSNRIRMLLEQLNANLPETAPDDKKHGTDKPQ